MEEDIIIRFLAYDLLSGIANEVAGAMGHVADVAEGSGNRVSQAFMSAGTAMMGIGIAAVGVAAGIAAGLFGMAQSAATFQSDMLLVHTQAKQSMATVQEFSNFILANAPLWGYGPDELAKAMYRVAGASTSLPSQLKDVAGQESILAASAELAQVGHADLLEVTDRLITVLNNYGQSGMTAAQAAGTLNTIVGEGKMSMSDLTAVLRNGLLPMAYDAGLSFQSLGAAIGTMHDQGVNATQVGTYLRSTLIQIETPSGVAAKALEAVGVGATEAAQMTDGFSQVLAAAGVNQTAVAAKLRETGSLGQTLQWLQDKMTAAGLKGHETAALLEKAFGGIRSGVGIAVLMSNLTALEQREKDITNSTNNFSDTWSFFVKNDPEFVVKQLTATLKTMEVILGSALIPTMRAVISVIQPLILRFADWAQQHQKLVGVIMVAVPVILGLAGGILMVGGAVLILLGLLTAMNPVVLVVMGLAVAFGFLVSRMQPNPFEAFGRGVTTFLNELHKGMDVAHAFGFALMAMGVPLHAAMDIGNGLAAAWKLINEIFGKVTQSVASLIGQFQKQLAQDPVMQQAIQQLGPALHDLGTFLMAVGAIIGILIGGVFQGLITALEFIIPGAIMVAEGVFQVLGGIVQLVADIIAGRWGKLSDDVQHISYGFLHIVEGLFYGVLGGVMGFVVGFVQGIIGAFQNLYDMLVGHSIVPDLINQIVNLFQNLPGQLLGMVGDWVHAGASLAEGLASGITSAASGIISAAEGVVNNALNAARNLLGNPHSPSPVTEVVLGLPIAQGIASGILMGGAGIEAAVTHVLAPVATPTGITTAIPSVAGGAPQESAELQNLLTQLLGELRSFHSDNNSNLRQLDADQNSNARGLAAVMEGSHSSLGSQLLTTLRAR